jgi:hypothetical protein
MGLPTVEDGGQTWQLDAQEPAYSALSGFADRVRELLLSDPVGEDPNLQASLDDLLGAIYALIFARKLGFTDRTDRPTERGPVAKRAEQLATGTVRVDGKWMAGFHFNSALFRIAAVSHRVLQIVAQCDNGLPKLCEEAGRLHQKWIPGRNWSGAEIQRVNTEVNKLKHRRKGLLQRRRVSYEDGLTAVDELLGLIEAWRTAYTPAHEP